MSLILGQYRGNGQPRTFSIPSTMNSTYTTISAGDGTLDRPFHYTDVRSVYADQLERTCTYEKPKPFLFPTERNLQRIASLPARSRPQSAPIQRGDNYIPGYTGHISGQNDAMAKTFGEVSREGLITQKIQKTADRQTTAKNLEARDLFSSTTQSAPVVSSQTASAKLDRLQRALSASAPARPQSAPFARNPVVSGYTGHIPHMKEEIGKTFPRGVARVQQQPVVTQETRELVTDPLRFTQTETKRPVPPETLEKAKGVGYGGHVPGYKVDSFGTSFARYTASVANFREEQQRVVEQRKADLLRGTPIPANLIVTAPSSSRPTTPLADASSSSLRPALPEGYKVIGGPSYYETPAITELGSSKAESQKLRTAVGRINSLAPRTKPLPLRATVTHIFRNPEKIVAEKENIPVEVKEAKVLPGYTGHIPAAKEQFAVSFGATVRSQSPLQARRPSSAPVSGKREAAVQGYSGLRPRCDPALMGLLIEGMSKALSDRGL